MNEKLLDIDSIEIAGKAVLVRGDFDVDDGENPRVESIRQVVKKLLEKRAGKISVVGHCETKFDVVPQLKKEFPGVEFNSGLRNDTREKANGVEFAKQLSEGFEVYVNEAFATSHRKHASIVALPEVFKQQGKQVAFGPRFLLEIEKLDQVWRLPGKRVLVIGGVKIDDKKVFAEEMKDKFIYVLKGGLLPGVDLRPDGLDISDAAIADYKMKIAEAEVILAAGVMGKYEDPGSVKGTQEILNAIANSRAYKVAGGGDIEMAISTFGLTERFDWISVGGGAMLEYLRSGTLVGIDAILN